MRQNVLYTYRDVFELPPLLTLVDILARNRSVFFDHRSFIFCLWCTANIELLDMHLTDIAGMHMLPILSGSYRQSLFKFVNLDDNMLNDHHVTKNKYFSFKNSTSGATQQKFQ